MRRAFFIVTALPAFLLMQAACKSSGSGSGDGDISSCGNIHVEASAKCQVEVSGGCTAHCEPISFVAACEGECTASFDASCKASCQADCSGSCMANPGSFDCSASCSGQCSASCMGECQGQCMADPNMAECQGSCEAGCQGSCEGRCDASCEGTPPSASCDAKCEASCEGECEVQANIGCDVDCEAKLEGGCEVECQSPDGALFCDGQYVDAGDNLAECIAALNAYLTVEVDSSSSAACSGGKCEASAEASATCAIAPPERSSNTGWLALAAAALGLSFLRRRR